MNILENIQGKCIHNRLAVRFDKDHNRILGKGLNGAPIVRVDKWTNEATKNEETSKLEENVDYKETHPQICVVTASNEKYPYKVGDKLFVHYMAYETAELGDLVTYDAMINADMVFFTILPDGSWKMAKDVYIGEAVVFGEEIRPSGIIASLGKKDQLRVNITHVPEPIENIHGVTIWNCIEVGEIAISIDKYNYEFAYDGKRYIKLTSKEIAGIYQEVA